MVRSSPEKKELMEEMARNRLYRAASDIIADKGWAAFTMDELAKSASMAKGTIYNYFRSKNEVVGFVVSRILEPMHRKFVELDCENGNPRELLEQMLDILTVDLFESPCALPALTEIKKGGGDVVSLFSSRMMAGRMIRVLERGAEEGIFRNYDPAFVVEFVTSALAGVGLRMARGDMTPGKGFNFFIKIMIMEGISGGK